MIDVFKDGLKMEDSPRKVCGIPLAFSFSIDGKGFGISLT